MIFKQIPTTIKDMNKLGAAMNSLGALKIGTVSINDTNIQSYRNAIKGLSAEQAAFTLSSKGANEEQIREIMLTETAIGAKDAYTNADIQAALAKNGLATTSTVLTTKQQDEIINSGLLASEKMAEMASVLGLETAESGALVTKEALNTESVKEQLTSIGVIGSTQAQILSILGLTAAESGAVVGTNLLTAAFQKLKKTIMSNPYLFIIGAVLAGCIGIYNAIKKHSEKAEERIKKIKEAAKEAKSEISNIKSDFENLSSSTNGIKEKFATLAQGVENLGKINQSRGKLSSEDYEEFLGLSNQLAELFPQLKVGLDDNGNSILGLSGNVDTIVDSLNNLVSVQKKLADQQIIEKVPNIWKGYIIDLSEYKSSIDKTQSLINGLSSFNTNGKVTIKDFDLYNTVLSKLEEIYYSDMKGLTAKKLVTLNSEAGQLKSILGSMSKDNEGYNNLFSELMDINKEIAELENNCIEFNSKIRDLDWEIFDYLEKSVSRITDETEYLTELLEKEDLFDENGSFTKYGDAALGLHSAAYEAYKIQADDYYKEILKLQKQLADGAGQDVLEHYNELADAHRDAVNAANSEKQSMLDLIEDGYNAQLDAIQELIDKKKEQLNSEKDLYDYQKSIAEKTAKVSSLEKQKLAYADDGSEEAMSRIQQLNVQLEEAKTDLAEAEYDKYLQDTEDMLDKLSENYENWINKRLDDENSLLSEIIGAVSDKGDRINGTLNEIAAKNGTFISDSIRGIFDADQPFAAVMNGVKDAVTGVGSAVAELKNAVLGISGAGNGANAVNTSTGSAGGIQSGKNAGPMSSAPSGGNSGRQGASSGGNSWGSWFVKKNDAYSKNKLNKDSSIVDRLKFFGIDSSFASRAAYYKAMGGDGSYISSASQNVWMLNQMKSHGYKSGTFRAVSGPHWTQENGSEFILRKSDGAMLVPLGQGDMVFSNESSKRLYEFAQNPEGFMKKYNLGSPLMTAMIPYPVLDYKLPNPAKAAQKNASASVSIGDINITCNEVQNARELMEDVTDHLIRNNRFEKAMSTMINNSMTGKNPLEHLKYVKH